MQAPTIGILAALGSAASWALGSILFKRLGENLSPQAMTLAKGGLSVAVLSLAVFVVGFEAIPQNTALLLGVSGLVGITLGDTFFFAALQHLSAHAVVVMLVLGQVLTVLLAMVFLGETPSLMNWWGIGLVVGGVALVLHDQMRGELQATRRAGIWFGLLVVICLSSSLIIAKQGLESVSAIQATWLRMLAGTAGMLAFGLARGRLEPWLSPLRDLRLLVRFCVAVLVITFGGFWLSLLALKHLNVAIANTLTATEPVFVIPLAALLLGERVSKQAAIGTAVTVAGIVVLCGLR